MVNISLICYILLLFHSPKSPWKRLAKFEEFGRYWLYCTRNRAITNAYIMKYIHTYIYIYIYTHYQCINVWIYWTSIYCDSTGFEPTTTCLLIELCCEYLSVQCIWLYIIIESHTCFRVNLHSIVTWMSRYARAWHDNNIPSNALYR